MAAVETDAPAIIVLPFGIRANHPRMSDLFIQAIPGCRLRSTISSMRPGPRGIPMGQATALAELPEIPGMELFVNPSKCEYMISDPLNDDEALQIQVAKHMRRQGATTNTKVGGVPTLRGTLDVHRMKTLCREMVNLANANEALVVKGALPEWSELEALPGKYLLNPGSRIQNQQPIYECEWDRWLEQLVRSGG